MGIDKNEQRTRRQLEAEVLILKAVKSFRKTISKHSKLFEMELRAFISHVEKLYEEGTPAGSGVVHEQTACEVSPTPMLDMVKELRKRDAIEEEIKQRSETASKKAGDEQTACEEEAPKTEKSGVVEQYVGGYYNKQK